jgi:hypothetical protein
MPTWNSIDSSTTVPQQYHGSVIGGSDAFSCQARFGEAASFQPALSRIRSWQALPEILSLESIFGGMFVPELQFTGRLVSFVMQNKRSVGVMRNHPDMLNNSTVLGPNLRNPLDTFCAPIYYTAKVCKR